MQSIALGRLPCPILVDVPHKALGMSRFQWKHLWGPLENSHTRTLLALVPVFFALFFNCVTNICFSQSIQLLLDDRSIQTVLSLENGNSITLKFVRNSAIQALWNRTCLLNTQRPNNCTFSYVSSVHKEHDFPKGITRRNWYSEQHNAKVTAGHPGRSVTWLVGYQPGHIQFPVIRGRGIQVSNAKQGLG